MSVFKFYNEGGRSESKKITKDSIFFENLTLLSQQYDSHS